MATDTQHAKVDSRYVVTFRAELSFSVEAATPAEAEEQARLMAFYMDDEQIRHEETVGHLAVLKHVRTEDSPDPDDEDDEDGPADVTGDHRAHGDVYRDGGWEDRDGFPVPPTTAPACDRTCLPCQGDDHRACGMGCHDEEEG